MPQGGKEIRKRQATKGRKKMLLSVEEVVDEERVGDGDEKNVTNKKKESGRRKICTQSDDLKLFGV